MNVDQRALKLLELRVRGLDARAADADELRELLDQVRARVGAEQIPGPAGPAGAQGSLGEPGPPGPIPRHEWRGTELRFEEPDGSWGKWTDLRGPRGYPGAPGGGVSSDAPVIVNSYMPGGW